MDALNNHGQCETAPEQAKSEKRWAMGEWIAALAVLVAAAMALGGAFGESRDHGGPLGMWSGCGGYHRGSPILRDLDVGNAAWCAVGSLLTPSDSYGDGIGLRFDFFHRR